MNASDDSGAHPKGGPQTSPAGTCDEETKPSRAQVHLDELLDRALRDTFPCSDPVSTLCVEDLGDAPPDSR